MADNVNCHKFAFWETDRTRVISIVIDGCVGYTRIYPDFQSYSNNGATLECISYDLKTPSINMGFKYVLIYCTENRDYINLSEFMQ